MSEQIKRLTQAIRDNESELSYGTIRTLAMIDAESEKSNARPALPDDIQRMIDAATICKTERHGCYGNNTECLFNRFDNGMGCLNNKHVTRLIEYITTGR